MRTLLHCVAIGLLLTACPKAETPAPVKAAEIVTEDGAPAKRSKPIFREPGSKRSDAICDELACSNEQREAVTQILADSMPKKTDRDRRRPDDAKAGNEALAAAFASASFDAAALATYHAGEAAAVAETRPQRQQAIAKALVDIHAVLEPDQRHSLADIVEKQGIAPFMGRARGFRGGAADAPDDARRARRMATRLCHRVACTGDQEDKLAVTLEKLPSGSELDPEPARAALATALRAESVPVSAVSAYFVASDAADDALGSVRDEAWLELHAALTPEQRKLLAESVSERGLAALHGGRGRARKAGPRGRPR